MLRKSPDHRPSVCVGSPPPLSQQLATHPEVWTYLCIPFPLFQASELLKHPHLQHYVFKLQLKSTLPHNLFSAKLPTKHNTNKTALSDTEDNSKLKYSKSHSFKLARAVKLDQSTDAHDPPSSTRTGKDCPELLSEQMEGLSIQVTKNVVDEVKHEKYSKATRPPAPTPRRSSSTPRRRLQPSKTFHARTAHKEVWHIWQFEMLNMLWVALTSIQIFTADCWYF